MGLFKIRLCYYSPTKDKLSVMLLSSYRHAECEQSWVGCLEIINWVPGCDTCLFCGCFERLNIYLGNKP